MRSLRRSLSGLAIVLGVTACSDDGNLGQDTDGGTATGADDGAPTSAGPAGDDDGTPTQSGDASQGGDTTEGPDTSPSDTTDASDDASTGTDGGTDTGNPATGCDRAGSYSVQTSTYFGGAMNWEHARDVAIDGEGNVVMVGGTHSSDFPTTPGAYDTTYDNAGGATGSEGTLEAFVVKFDPTGQLLWSTLIGGPNYDRAYAVEIDDAGDIYIGGRAGPGFPTTPGALQPTFAGTNAGIYGMQNGFAAKILADGSDVVWATYVGIGALVRDIDIDDSGAMVVKMGSNQGSAAVTAPGWMAGALAGSFQPSPANPRDSGIVLLDTDGQVQWASWIGGNNVDTEEGSVRLDGAGHPVVAFNTQSNDLPTTPGVVGPSFGGGEDVYVAMFTPDGSDLVFGTYVGGSGSDAFETHALGVTDDAVYVMAMTDSDDFPVTAGAYQSARAGALDVGIVRLDHTGALVAGTYFGGNAGDGADGFSVASDGEVFFVGETSSTDLPVTADAHQSSLATGPDAYLVRLSADLSTLRYASYMGGQSHDTGRGGVIADDCTIVLVGAADGPGYPVVDPWQAAFAGGAGQFGNGDTIMTKLTFE